jgi:glycosyltransferase involved in cell wall biosynthesis
MADALADVLSKTQRRRRLVERGFERAARFEWTQAARALLEVYRTVARG